jgi:Lon protease-like protein
VFTSPLPLFPLGLVLLPGATVPLHIFEPRYQAMLRDVTSSGGGFGIIAPPDGVHEADVPSGRIGCIAQVLAVEPLPDGRANITVRGGQRFRFERYIDAGTAYRMGDVTPHEDVPDDAAALARTAEHVRACAQRVLRASMTVRDASGDAPVLASDATTLSFDVAHLLRANKDVLYGMLEERHPLTRLQRLDALLGSVLPDLEAAAELHVRARTNGHHHGHPRSDS